MSKRIFDIICAGLGLLVLSPVLALVALAVRATSRGPVLFRQERVGRFGRSFRILKFRTMVPEAEAQGRQLTAAGDSRITPIGQLLRASKLDELPQLINVIRGEMALVGPRPEVPRYVARYTEEQRRVLEVRPGITDWASIAYRHESEILARAEDPEKTYLEDIMPHKIALNLAYLQRRRGVLSDLEVVLRTLRAVLPCRRHGDPWADLERSGAAASPAAAGAREGASIRA